LEKVSSLVDTIKIVEENDVYHMFDESPNSEVSQLGFEEINFVDFLGVENFLSSFPSQNFDVRFIMLKENFIPGGQEIIDSFWNKFMTFEKINKERVKIEFS